MYRVGKGRQRDYGGEAIKTVAGGPKCNSNGSHTEKWQTENLSTEGATPVNGVRDRPVHSTKQL